jgi:hypothetical protein
MGRTEEIGVSNIDNQTFAKMVAEEVKNKLSPNQRRVLLEKENWERWRLNLVALLENLDAQTAAAERSRIADIRRYESFGNEGLSLLEQANASYNSRVQKIARFRFHVERRLNEIATMIDTGEISENNGWQNVEFLKRGIARHRALLKEYDLEETVIDRALWSLLDDRWEFDGIKSVDIV